MIMRGISTSINSIKLAIATSWSTIVAVAAVTVAIVGIVYVINKVRVLYSAAQRTISAVKAKLKKKGVTHRNGTNSVYAIYPNKSDYDVCYVGRTQNFKARQYRHQKRPGAIYPEKSYTMIAVATGLSKAQSRALEQTLITAYSLKTLDNMINSISPRKWKNFKSEYKQMRSLIQSWIDPE